MRLYVMNWIRFNLPIRTIFSHNIPYNYQKTTDKKIIIPLIGATRTTAVFDRVSMIIGFPLEVKPWQ